MSSRKGLAESVQIKTPTVTLQGDLFIPPDSKGIALFAHGSGSSRFSPRNRYVAQLMRQKGVGSLLLDLLTAQEGEYDERTAALRFDIKLLASRLMEATDWMINSSQANGMKLGYFGASTGAAAALIAAAERPVIRAVVSRGGRPDLAEAVLPGVKAPTLLIVGGEDHDVILMNRSALNQLKSEKKMVIIPGATHLFEEPGALDQVAELAADWFTQHFTK